MKAVREGKSGKGNLSDDLLHGFKWSTASMILQAVLQLTVISVLARLLSPREFGIVGMAMIFTNFFERVGFLGAGPAIIQRKEVTSAHVRAAHMLSVGMGLVLFLLMFLSAPLIAAFFREPQLVNVMRVLSLAFFIDGVSTIPESLLQRDLRFRTLMMAANGAYLLGSGVVGIGLALSGFGVWSLVWAAISMRVVKAAAYQYVKPQKLAWRIPLSEAREILRTGLGFSVGKLLSIIALVGDNFVVGRFLGAAALGMYGRAYQLMSIPATYFGQILERVMFPIMAKRQGQNAELRQIFFYSIECGALIGLPAGIFIYLTAPEIIRLLFGEKWLVVAPTLQILALGTFPRLCYKQSDTLLRSLGAVYRYAARQMIYTFLVLAGAAAGCMLGLEAVAAAVSFAVTVNYLVLSQLGIRLLDASWKSFVRAHLPGAWCALLVGAGVHLFVAAARGWFWSPLAVVGGSTLLALFLAASALRWSPPMLRARVIVPLARVIRFERFGLPGRVANWVLYPERA